MNFLSILVVCNVHIFLEKIRVFNVKVIQGKKLLAVILLKIVSDLNCYRKELENKDLKMSYAPFLSPSRSYQWDAAKLLGIVSNGPRIAFSTHFIMILNPIFSTIIKFLRIFIML